MIPLREIIKRKGNYGVLATRKPRPLPTPPGEPTSRCDARQNPELRVQLPPRNKRLEPVVGPVELVTLPDE